MPTENRRVAAYLPKELDDRFTAFKTERGLGDSQALIVILSEFLEVSQQVSHSVTHSSFVTLEQVQEVVNERFLQLQSQIQELKDRTAQTEDLRHNLSWREYFESHRESSGNPSIDGQLNILDTVEDSMPGELSGELPATDEDPTSSPKDDSSPESLTETELAQKLRCGKSSLREWKAKGAEFLAEKTKALPKAKPDGIAWAFDAVTKHYYPLPDSEASNQVNSLPEGSERSEES